MNSEIPNRLPSGPPPLNQIQATSKSGMATGAAVMCFVSALFALLGLFGMLMFSMTETTNQALFVSMQNQIRSQNQAQEKAAEERVQELEKSGAPAEQVELAKNRLNRLKSEPVPDMSGMMGLMKSFQGQPVLKGISALVSILGLGVGGVLLMKRRKLGPPLVKWTSVVCGMMVLVNSFVTLRIMREASDTMMSKMISPPIAGAELSKQNQEIQQVMKRVFEGFLTGAAVVGAIIGVGWYGILFFLANSKKTAEACRS